MPPAVDTRGLLLPDIVRGDPDVFHLKNGLGPVVVRENYRTC